MSVSAEGATTAFALLREDVLEALAREGLEDVEAGRVSEWSLEEFLREVRSSPQEAETRLADEPPKL